MYKLPLLRSWGFVPHTKVGAIKMALEHSRKMQFFYALYNKKGEEKHIFTQDEVSSYVPSKSFNDWADGVPLISRTRGRLQELEALRPRLQ